MDRLNLAIEAGRQASKLILKYFAPTRLGAEFKSDLSPVTVADREAERWLREKINQLYPNDGILGEEYGEKIGTTEYRWLLDPIDGTRTFVNGVPLFGTLIGIEHNGEATAGVLLLPALHEYLYASKGNGAWHVTDDDWEQGGGGCVPQQARVSSVESLSEAVFCTTHVQTYLKTNRMAAHDKLTSQVQMTAGWGDCYGYALVATGRADIMIDPIMNDWDCAAIKPIIEEAGGTFTDWQGHATIYGKEAVATNGLLSKAVLQVTREFPKK
jgi:histidinol-phosphatase